MSSLNGINFTSDHQMPKEGKNLRKQSYFVKNKSTIASLYDFAQNQKTSYQFEMRFLVPLSTPMLSSDFTKTSDY
jgi:hypothetical protein